VSKRLVDDGQLITSWSPVNLKIELDNLLWKDKSHIDVKMLWEYFCTYLYLPRLANEDVFVRAISEGLRSKDYFGHADKVENGGRYLGLVFGGGRSSINRDGLSVLVRPEVAQRQLDEDEKKRRPIPPVTGNGGGTSFGGTILGGTGGTGTTTNPPREPATILKPKVRRFHGTVDLDLSRPIPNAGQIVENVIQHLQSGDGTSAP
jgi:hypothetical protein